MIEKLLPATRTAVYSAIDAERQYQEGWKNPDLTDSGGVHSNLEYLVYIRDYVDEALHIASRKPDSEARVQNTHALRKIAAMAVAALEQNGVLLRNTEDNLVARHNS